MWDLPGPGLEPVSPALAGGFLTTAPPGKSLNQDVLSVFASSWLYKGDHTAPSVMAGETKKFAELSCLLKGKPGLRAECHGRPEEGVSQPGESAAASQKLNLGE